MLPQAGAEPEAKRQEKKNIGFSALTFMPTKARGTIFNAQRLKPAFSSRLTADWKWGP